MEDPAQATGGIRTGFSERFGSLLSWSYVDKSMAIAALTLPFTLVLAAYSYYVLHHRELAPFLDFDYLPVIVAVASAGSLGWVFFLGLGLWLRKRDPQNRAYVQLLHLLWYGGTIYQIYCYGLPTSPASIQVLGGALVGVLLFDLRCVLPVLLSAVAALVGLLVAERVGLIPYAPLLAGPPYVDGRLSDAWFAIQVFMFFAITGTIFVFATQVMLRWRSREDELREVNEFLRRTFGRYLSTEVMRAVLADPKAVELGGSRRRVSIMMNDIRGFTQIAERLAPEQVVLLINRYLRVMAEICDKHGGTVNDIAGDGMLITFGAPLAMENHAEASVACALEMQNAVEGINRENIADGLPPIQLGIGLNTAEVVVGNIGSELRSKYGVVGSGVNMASRIESYAVGGQVLVSGSVLKEAQNLRIDRAMEVFPKGIDAPLMIYEIGGISGHYNVLLHTTPDGLAMPLKPVWFSYRVLSGKQVGAHIHRAEVPRLSNSAAMMKPENPLELHDDMKVNLERVSIELAHRSFYAKVVRVDEDGGVLLRFTSVPGEIAAYFEGLRLAT